MLNENEFRKLVSDYIQEQLIVNNVTKYKLAKDLGVAYNQVKSWIGMNCLPSSFYLYKIQKYFNKQITF